MPKMTKKIKIIIASILTFVLLVTTIFILLSFNTKNYMFSLEKPAFIVVYKDDFANNIVYEPDDKEFLDIYNLVCSSYEKPLIKAFISGDLNKNVKIINTESQEINFKSFKIGFEYSSPKPVKKDKNIYTLNGEDYWYKSLIFDVNSEDKFQYNNIAIIPPIDANYYLGQNTYCLHYKSFGNFNNVYNYVSHLFI